MINIFIHSVANYHLIFAILCKPIIYRLSVFGSFLCFVRCILYYKAKIKTNYIEIIAANNAKITRITKKISRQLNKYKEIIQ